jgi:UDP-glucose 4-epimerase
VKKAVLITGASGFIGKHVAQTLAKAGWRVRAAARNPESVPG